MSIVLKAVSKTFVTDNRIVEALEPTDLECPEGSFTSVLGPSGCGKTTLLRIIAGLEAATSGEISVMGMDPDEARKRRVYGMMFQRPVLLPWRTVTQNIRTPAEIAGSDDPRRVEELVRLVGLEGFEDAFPSELSGGMQSRVGIARALMLHPTVLLMDEPFAALDQITREKMQVELARICEVQGVTAVLVTHSIPEAIFLGDQVAVMSARPGRLIAQEMVPFKRPRTIDCTELPEFTRLARKLRDLL